MTYAQAVVPQKTMAEHSGHGWRNKPGGDCSHNRKSFLSSRFQTFHGIVASGVLYMADPSEGIACATRPIPRKPKLFGYLAHVLAL